MLFVVTYASSGVRVSLRPRKLPVPTLYSRKAGHAQQRTLRYMTARVATSGLAPSTVCNDNVRSAPEPPRYSRVHEGRC